MTRNLIFRYNGPILALFTILLAIGCGKSDPAASKAAATVQGDQKIRNVLIITVDTWRYDRVGLHGKLVRTPHIDRFAEEALHYKRAFTHNPCTLPAHTNIMTGTTPLYHGISDNSGFRLEPRFLTMAEYFKEKNWQTAAFIGAFPLDSRFGLDQGFDLYDEKYKSHSEHEGFFSERPANDVIDTFIQWAEKQDKSRNWFNWIHLFDPHQPYLPPKPFADEYPADPYSGEVAFTDQELGRLWAWMKEQGIYDSTLIVLVGDHGEALGEHGERTHAYFAYNNTIHIPMFIRIPGIKGRIVDENVSHIDIFPTICEALSQKIPAHLQGQSMLIAHPDRRIYFESLTPYYNRNWAPLRGYIHQDDKYIDLPIQELFDISRDPDENANLIKGLNWKAHRKALEEIVAKLINQDKPERLEGIETDPKVVLRLQSLGYLPSDKSVKKTIFLPKDDLKTLLPIQNLMLDGMAQEHMDQYEEALRIYEAVITQREDFILTYTYMSSIYKKTAQYDRAIEILRRGLTANQDNIFLLSQLGILLAEHGRPAEAVDILKNVITREDSNPETYTYLGIAYHRQGEDELALAQFAKGLTLDRSNALLHNNIGAVYLETFLKTKSPESYNSAMEAYNQALEIDDKLHTALNGRGAAFSFGNQPERAMDDWYRAITAKKDFPDPYINLGILLKKQGQPDKARDLFLACKNNCQRTLVPPERQRLERLISELNR